jgi:hypothetical protein
MKSQKIHRWLSQRIAKNLPKNCSWCERSDSERWVPLLLCDNNFIHNRKHFILCGDCYSYYDRAEADYRFWIERNMKSSSACLCGGIYNG